MAIKAKMLKTKATKLPSVSAESKGDQVRSLREKLLAGLVDAGMVPTREGEDGACADYGVFIEDVYDNTVVFACGNYDDLHAANYKANGEKIEFSNKIPVARRTIYVERDA